MELKVLEMENIAISSKMDRPQVAT